MNHRVVGFIAACVVAMATVSAPAIATGPVVPSGGQSWTFRVLLDGREVGEHRFQLQTTGSERELQSDARFDVRLLFVNAYRYRHHATERWSGNCLRSMTSRTESNSDKQSVTATTRGDKLVVEHDGISGTYDGCVMTFAYWNPEILHATRMVNSQTGEVLPVQVRLVGDESVMVRGEQRTSQRVRIEGRGLQIDVWYADRNWVGLEALTDGRLLRYELK